MTITKGFVQDIQKNLRLERRFLQIIIGARQTGKTTAASRVQKEYSGPSIWAAADAPLPPGPEWVVGHWERARTSAAPGVRVLLVLDEIQKVKGWSEMVKALWDDDTREGRGIDVILLGSSSLLLQQGCTESLAGRFQLHRCRHWTFPEMRDGFGFSLDKWLFFGGYPGAAALVADEPAWRSYVGDSLIETVLSRDIFQLQTVNKPALMRHLFAYAVGHPAQVVSYNKMLGQLDEAGNTTTLAHYLHLLSTAFLISGLDIIRPSRGALRGGSPKIIVWNNALINAAAARTFAQTSADTSLRGRLVENAVGAHMLNGLNRLGVDVGYWRHRDNEVDFVVRTPAATYAVEVKSGRRSSGRGLGAYREVCPGAKPVVIGTGGIPLEEFLSTEPSQIFL
jgi:hypothetical protein